MTPPHRTYEVGPSTDEGEVGLGLGLQLALAIDGKGETNSFS